MQYCKTYRSRHVIPAKNVFTYHEYDCHVLDHMLCLRFVLRFDTVLWSSVWKRNVDFYWRLLYVLVQYYHCCDWMSPFTVPWYHFLCSYEGCLKEANRLGVKKGLSVGVSLGMVFFLIFLVDAAAFWSVCCSCTWRMCLYSIELQNRIVFGTMVV